MYFVLSLAVSTRAVSA